MAAVLARHQFEDDARLAVALDAEHDAFIDPLHGGYVCTLAVIPGRGRAADPESIVTDCGYGFRVRRCAAPRNDDSDRILLLRKLQPHLAVALRVVAPAFPHLHEQEQVHRLLDRNSAISLRAAAPIALIVWPPLPSTILRWLSRST